MSIWFMLFSMVSMQPFACSYISNSSATGQWSLPKTSL